MTVNTLHHNWWIALKCVKNGKNQTVKYGILWAGELMKKKKIGPTKAQYGFLESVLAIIKDIAPGHIENLERLEKTLI